MKRTHFDLPAPVAPVRPADLRLFRVEPIPLVDCEFYVRAATIEEAGEVVCDRAAIMELPLIWRAIIEVPRVG